MTYFRKNHKGIFGKLGVRRGDNALLVPPPLYSNQLFEECHLLEECPLNLDNHRNVTYRRLMWLNVGRSCYRYTCY